MPTLETIGAIALGVIIGDTILILLRIPQKDSIGLGAALPSGGGGKPNGRFSCHDAGLLYTAES